MTPCKENSPPVKTDIIQKEFLEHEHLLKLHPKKWGHTTTVHLFEGPGGTRYRKGGTYPVPPPKLRACFFIKKLFKDTRYVEHALVRMILRSVEFFLPIFIKLGNET